MSELQAIVQDPAGDAGRVESRVEAAVIWMHGLGATAHDFEAVPPELGLPTDHRIRFVFPQAPSIPVTLNAGMVMPAWYDIRNLGGRDQDEAGIGRSEQSIRGLIEQQMSDGIAADKIVLGGFSQGGAMALHTGLRFPLRLAGVMVLSGYLLLADQLADQAAEANRATSIFQAHGTYDPMVRHDWALKTRERLEQLGYPVESHDYPMAHQVCAEEIDHIGAWLRRVLLD